MRLFWSWLAMAATIALIASVMPGLAIDGMATCLGVAGVFAVVHSVLRPVLRSPTRPLLIAVGGIGSLALDAVILVVLARLLDGVRLDGFAALLSGALAVSIVSLADLGPEPQAAGLIDSSTGAGGGR